MHRDAYTGVIILIVGFITINYISKEFIFEEKRQNEISENKFYSKITRYTVVLTKYRLVSDPVMEHHTVKPSKHFCRNILF